MSKQTDLDIKAEQPAATVEQYKFEPIKGYPMLQWKGKRPFTSTQFYPAQLKENHGEAFSGWMNRIYWGDNLQVMSHLLKEFRGKVDLGYIDPPFDSKAEYKKQIILKGKEATGGQSSFEEKQYTDIWTNDTYLQFLFERLVLIRELLSDNGFLFIHCDWHKVHLIRLLAEEVFGPANFRNEIVWAYPGREMHIDLKFNCKHDTLLLFAKSESARINMSSVAIPYDKEERLRTLRRKVHKDEDGREWVWETRGQSSGEEPYKRYVEEIISEGKALNDVWTDVQFLRGNDPERVDYPTQKPEALLDRIIKAGTKPGGLVFDGFMGSGTTQAVAMRIGRRFIGADINLGAIQTTTKRLIEVANDVQTKQSQGELKTGDKDGEIPHYYTGFSVYNVNHYDIFRNPAQAKDLLIEALEIQPLPSNALYDGEKDGRMVKIMPINRIATKADINDLLTGFDYKAFQKRREQSPSKPVESLLLVCMGHEPDLAAHLERECQGFNLDVEVVDILRAKAKLEFKRDSEAEIKIEKNVLKIAAFYPMNLLQKLSLMKENVGEWRELTESVMVDWNYDGAVFEPKVVDVPGKNALVKGEYDIPPDAGTIRVKITDLLSESLETEVARG